MKLAVTKSHHTRQFNDELVAAVAALIEGTGENRVARHRVESDGTTLSVTVPDDVDTAAVQAVIDAHTPDPNWHPLPGLRQARRYLRNTIWPKLDAMTTSAVLTNLERDLTFKAMLVLFRDLYSRD